MDGTAAIVGVATFTAESIHNAGIDADGITVDAADGIDTKTEGTLYVGDATANRIEIGDTAIITDVEGPLSAAETLAVIGVGTFTAQPIFNGGIDVNEDVDIDFNATDEEVNIATTVNPDGSAGAGMVTLYDAEDANGANSAYMLRIARKNDGGANNEFILCEDNSTGAAGNGDDMFSVDAGGDVTMAGDLTVTGLDIDSGAGAMTVGADVATSLALGASDITTSVTGPLQAGIIETLVDATASTVLTSADYGRILLATQAGGVTFTLPANGATAGSWIDFMQGDPADNTTAITVAAAVVDTLITANDAAADSVTMPAGHRIGGYIRAISNGAFWMILNLGQTTMTVTT